MDLNRFSIDKRLNWEQIQEICTHFNITRSQFIEGTMGREINFKLCDYVCRYLGYRKWYPKYWPRSMGQKNGWASNKDAKKALKKVKEKRKKVDNTQKESV